jgi:mono/diheme cytochrome c family protein
MNWKIPAALASVALVCSAPVASAAAAAELYAKHCKSCHGADGKGQTAMGKRSKAKDYTTAEGQKWSDAEGVKAILEGKEKMKGYKDKGVTEADAKALVAYIRAFKK